MNCFWNCWERIWWACNAKHHSHHHETNSLASSSSSSPVGFLRRTSSRTWPSSPASLSNSGAQGGGGERLLQPMLEVQRKIVLLGFRAVGKSALAMQFTEGRYVEAYDPTIENTFRTTIRLNKVRFVCDILDTAGQDEYSSISRQASVGVHGYVLVYSSTSRSSFEDVKMIHDKLLKLIGAQTVPKVLVATKCDLMHYREVRTEDGQALAQQWGCPFIECSAKENWKVEEVFVTLISHIDTDLLMHGEDQRSCMIM